MIHLFRQVYSARSDGEDAYSCRLYASPGTSMSCPIVAGASAMVRQLGGMPDACYGSGTVLFVLAKTFLTDEGLLD